MEKLTVSKYFLGAVPLSCGARASLVAFCCASLLLLFLRRLAETMKSPVDMHSFDTERCTSLVNEQLASLVVVLH
jgi:hypothetical protein